MKVDSEASRTSDAVVVAGLVGTAGGTVLVALALAGAIIAAKAAWPAWCTIAGSALMVSGCVVLGMRRSSLSRGASLFVGLILLVDIVAGFGAPMLLPPESAAGPLLLGLPLRAAIEVYGVGLLPLVVLPVLFAARFRADGFDADSIERLRARCAALGSASEAPPQ